MFVYVHAVAGNLTVNCYDTCALFSVFSGEIAHEYRCWMHLIFNERNR